MGPKTDESTNAKQRKTTSLPSKTVDYLKAWMMSPEHIAHPYPTEKEKATIMVDTGIELKQLTNWFVNNRKRYWKPRVEARLQQQAQVQRAAAAAAAVVASNQSPPDIHSFNIGFFSSEVSNQQNPCSIPWNTKQSLNALSSSLGSHSNATTSGIQEQMQQSTSIATIPGMTSPPSQVYQYSSDASNSDCFPSIVTNTGTNSSIRQTSVGSVTNPQAVSICSSSSDSDSQSSSSHSNEDSSSTMLSPPRNLQANSLLSLIKDEINSQHTICQTKIQNQTNETTITQNEVIDINVLNPSRFGKSYDQVDPTLEDVTISPNVPRDHVLRLFPDCNISYSYPSCIGDNQKEIQKYRDAEVVKVKRQFLDLYLSENSGSDRHQQHSAEVSISSTENNEMDIDSSVSPPQSTMKRIRSSSDFAVDYMNTCPRSLAFDCNKSIHDTQSIRDHIAMAKKKRVSPLADDNDFQEACCNARNGYDSSLPSLEEATFLFGYSRGE